MDSKTPTWVGGWVGGYVGAVGWVGWVRWVGGLGFVPVSSVTFWVGVLKVCLRMTLPATLTCSIEWVGGGWVGGSERERMD